MQLPKTFDAECVALMGRVCYDAWWELKCLKPFPSTAAEHKARSLLALRVMEAVAQGERDPACLRRVALETELGAPLLNDEYLVPHGGQSRRGLRAKATGMSPS
jgi:hypothetical protein